MSTDQQSVFIEANVPPVFSKKRYSEATPDRVSDPVSDDRTCSGRGYDDSDVDLIGGSGQKSSSNKDRLSGKRHAGAFQRNNDGNDPRSMDLDQTNQRTRERSKVHFCSSKSLAGMTSAARIGRSRQVDAAENGQCDHAKLSDSDQC